MATFAYRAQRIPKVSGIAALVIGALALLGGFSLVGSASGVSLDDGSLDSASLENGRGCKVEQSGPDGRTVLTSWAPVDGADSYLIYIFDAPDHEVTGQNWDRQTYPDGTSGYRRYDVAPIIDGVQDPLIFCGYVSFDPPITCSAALQANGVRARIDISRDPAPDEGYQVWRNNARSLIDNTNPLYVDVEPGNNHLSVQLLKWVNGGVVYQGPRVYCGVVRVDSDRFTPSSCQVTSVNGGLRVSWTAGDQPEAYQLYRLRQPVWRADGTDRAFDDTSTRDGKRYHYSVVALVNLNPGDIPNYEERGPRVYCGSEVGANPGLPAPAACRFEFRFRAGAVARHTVLDLPGVVYQVFDANGMVASSYVPEDAGEREVSVATTGTYRVRAVRPNGGVSEFTNCST